jgi:hypothetical protein
MLDRRIAKARSSLRVNAIFGWITSVGDATMDDIAKDGQSFVPKSYDERLTALRDLKDFAVWKGYDVPGTLISDINKLQATRPASSASPLDPVPVDQMTELDQLTITLTQITFPVTILNVERVRGRTSVTPFVYVLLLVGLIAALVSAISGLGTRAVASAAPCPLAAFAKLLTPMCLGIVGAVVFVMLPNGRLNTVVGLDAENITDTVVRVVMGGLLGYVLYVAGTSLFDPTKKSDIDWLLILPLLGGYSITLVVGILSKAVAAFQLTFNIDDKAVRASLQK